MHLAAGCENPVQGISQSTSMPMKDGTSLGNVKFTVQTAWESTFLSNGLSLDPRFDTWKNY